MFDEVRQVLESTFKTSWASLGGGVKVAYHNVAFVQPTGDGAEFARLTIAMGDGSLMSLGTKKREEQFGLVILQIFTPKNKGSHRSRVIADYAAPIFRYKHFRQGSVEVRFHQAPRIVTAEERADFFQENLQMPFRASQIFTVTQ